MHRACGVCGTELIDGSGSCGPCGAVGRVRHFETLGALQTFQADWRRHGADPRVRPSRRRYPMVVPFMVVLGAVFLLTGAVHAYAAARSEAGLFQVATLAGAIVPLAWGVALLALARRLQGRETP